jgi:hypothetical protein
MSDPAKKRRAWRGRLGIVTAAGLLAFGSVQARADPFAGLSGSWSGGGTIETSDGTRERIRCRATYEVAGAELQQQLRCASDSYRFEVESTVRYNKDAGLISGTWRETTREVGGRATGPARDGRLKARVEGPGFAADLEVVTQGDRQSVTIRADNADVTEVRVELRRG